MNDKHRPSRRLVLGGMATAIAAPHAVRAQSPVPVKLTLPWLAQGATGFVYVANAIESYRKHGLEVQVSRGFGSLAAAQAVGQKQFDFGIVSAGPMILAAARGAPLVGLATINYDTTMGILVLKDSPIQSPGQLAGKKIGAVVTSAEFPFWPAYAKKAGIDPAGVEIVQVDNRVLERLLIDRKVDAITCIGASSIPVLAAQGAQHRFMSFSALGIAPYSNLLTTRPEVLAEKPKLCEAMTAALMEGLAYQLKEPEKSIDILLKEVPELAITAGGRENARISQGLLQSTIAAPESMEHGLGWTDPARWKETVDLTMTYAVPAGTARPGVDGITKNQFVGGEKLSGAEWDKIKTGLVPYSQMLS